MHVLFAEPKMSTKTSVALKFTVLAECSTTRARTSLMELPHATVETPVFMPVGTQGNFFSGLRGDIAPISQDSDGIGRCVLPRLTALTLLLSKLKPFKPFKKSYFVRV